jgi:hypothetical protein
VAVALALVAVATLVPTRDWAGRGGVSPWCFACGDYGWADFAANVALFAPLGWALARAPVRLQVGLAAVLITTIGIELLQYAFVPGRVASVSDVVANTAGAVVGMVLPRLERWVTASRARALAATVLYAALLVVSLGLGSAAQVVPLPRALRWTEGNAAHPYVPFLGVVSAVRINGASVPVQQWRDVPSQGGVEIAIDILSGRPDTGLAQVIVVRRPGRGERGWVWLEQRDRDLRVHLASASDDFRLRGHSEWLLAALPATPGDRVAMGVVVRPFSYRIVVGSGSRVVVRDARVTLGDGWRLLVPFERKGEPWASLLTAAWMAVLLGPLGYVASVRSRATSVVAAVGASASLLLLPILSGCAGLPLPGWCGALIGFLGGVLHYRVSRAGRFLAVATKNRPMTISI